MRATKHSSILASCLLLLSATGLTERAGAAVYNLHLVTDNVPDYTNLESFVESVAGHLDTPQEKCIAVWRWGRRSRRQTSCSKEDGRLIWDPIVHYNSYGTMNCGITSALNMVSWLKLGYKARYVQLSDHTVSEVSWDDGASWHLFDSSMSFFCYNDHALVASCEEIKEPHAGKFSGGASEPGYYYYYNGAPQCVSHRDKDGWRCCSDNPVAYQRTLFNGASSYTNGVSVDGKSWRQGGAVEHDDLWKPPGDYEPWEHDDSPQYADLPAGGRLAYSYPLAFEQLLAGRYVRVVCMPLEGRGMGLSEIEVFDRVGVSPAPALVASPPHSSQAH